MKNVLEVIALMFKGSLAEEDTDSDDSASWNGTINKKSLKKLALVKEEMKRQESILGSTVMLSFCFSENLVKYPPLNAIVMQCITAFTR